MNIKIFSLVTYALVATAAVGCGQVSGLSGKDGNVSEAPTQPEGKANGNDAGSQKKDLGSLELKMGSYEQAQSLQLLEDERLTKAAPVAWLKAVITITAASGFSKTLSAAFSSGETIRIDEVPAGEVQIAIEIYSGSQLLKSGKGTAIVKSGQISGAAIFVYGTGSGALDITIVDGDNYCNRILMGYEVVEPRASSWAQTGATSAGSSGSAQVEAIAKPLPPVWCLPTPIPEPLPLPIPYPCDVVHTNDSNTQGAPGASDANRIALGAPGVVTKCLPPPCTSNPIINDPRVTIATGTATATNAATTTAIAAPHCDVPPSSGDLDPSKDPTPVVKKSVAFQKWAQSQFPLDVRVRVESIVAKWESRSLCPTPQNGQEIACLAVAQLFISISFKTSNGAAHLAEADASLNSFKLIK